VLSGKHLPFLKSKPRHPSGWRGIFVRMSHTLVAMPTAPVGWHVVPSRQISDSRAAKDSFRALEPNGKRRN
jgi:hypothetical protein